MTDRQHAAELAIALRDLLRNIDEGSPYAFHIENAKDALAAWDRHHNAQPDQQRALDL